MELEFKKSEKVRAAAWLDSLIDSLDDKSEYVIEVKKKRHKRSLSANAYFWTLCGKLAEKLCIPKDEIYRGYVRNIGGNTELMRMENRCVKAFERAWRSQGIGWQVETAPSGYDGWTDCIAYFGSSVYDSETMSRLIGLAVQDCKAQDIPTLDDIEIERICSEWSVQSADV